MATFIRQNEINDIFLLDNGEYVSFPRSMQMSEQDVSEFYNEID